MVSAPFAGMVLAEQGADVIKIELPDGVGDRARMIGSRRNGISAMFSGVNRGKRSVVVDSRTAEGAAVLADLVAGADVLIQNFRPGAAERMGIGAAELCERHPDLIHVSVSGFGETGPRADEKVYDYVVQAMTGMADLQADGAGEPQLIQQFVIDKNTALMVSQAVTAALFARERGHGGQAIRLSMLDLGLWYFWPDGMMDLALVGDGIDHAPHFASLYEIRRTTDGHIALIAAGNRSWPGLCAAFDPSLEHDPRFATYELREQHADELKLAFDRAVGALSTAEALDRMRANDVPGAAVAPRTEIVADPQIVHNDSVVLRTTDPIGEIREPRPPVSFDGAARALPGPVPAYDEHTDEVLAEIGYELERIADLRRSGAVGGPASTV